MALLGLVVFAAVYALLAAPWLVARARASLSGASPFAQTWGARALSRPGIAVAGALVLVTLGAVAPARALAAIDWRTLALLLGMMLLVAALEVANTFGVLANRLVRHLPTPRRLLVGSMVTVAVLSALVLNDAVVLLFTPVLVKAARSLGTSPFPLLAGEAFASNLGSAATPVGNPQNAAIALARDLSFVEFTRALAPVALAALAIGIVLCLIAFRRELRAARVATEVPPERIAHPALFLLAVLGVAGALVGFVLAPAYGVPLWAVALSMGLVTALLATTTRVPVREVVGKVDVGILAFFVGLFVLLEGVRDAGALDALDHLLARGGSGGYVVATAILSNLVSNVPAVLLLLPTVSSDAQALLLAAASTFAGNATFLGSAATVIVAETARASGADFSVARFTLVGLPLASLTLLLAWLVVG